jgi:phenylacetate-CoA ligase
MTWQQRIRRPLYDVYWCLFRNRFYESMQEQRRIRMLPLHEIRKLQWARLKRLLRYAFEHTDYYRRYFASAGLTPDDITQPQDLLRLPLTDKQTYRACFKQIIPRHVRERDGVLSHTSGSSGEPFGFYCDPTMEAAHLSAAFVLNKEAVGIAACDKINELVLKTRPKNRIDPTKEGELNRPRRRSWRQRLASEHIGISTVDITPRTAGDIARLIESRNIQAIYGYSSSVFALARYLSAHPGRPRMKYVITIAETLLRQQRNYISDVFDCPVYMDYSASECMRMGFECACQDGYHMDIYNYYFEYLDGTGYAPENTVGEIVVTNLNNYVFPFIRYRVGDLAEPCGRLCRCGMNLPLVHKLGGRPSDIIATPAGRNLNGALFAALFERLDQYVRQFQVVQTAREELEVRIVPVEQLHQNVQEHVEEELRTYVGRDMMVRVVPVNEIAPEPTGKRRLIVPLQPGDEHPCPGQGPAAPG